MIKFTFSNLTLVGLFVLCLGFGFSSCTTVEAKVDVQKSTIELKPLLDRSGQMASMEEWRLIKQTVASLHDKINASSADHASTLYLAAMYMQEARTTGEHPYYYPAALDLVNHVIDSKPQKEVLFQALVTKGSIMLSQHQFAEALEIANLAKRIEDSDAKVYGILTDAYVELGDYPNAVIAADKMVSIRPDLRSYSRVSYLRELHGDFDGAIEALDLAISAGVPGHENTSWCRYTLGELHEQHGDLKNAESQYRQALKERPGYAFAVAGLARIAANRNKISEAISLTEEAIEVIPEFSFYEQLASYYEHQKNEAKVEEISKQLVVMLEEDQESGHNMNLELANIKLSVENNVKAALEFANREYAVRPNNIAVCEQLAKIYAADGDFQSADKYISRALRTNFSSPHLRGLAGWIKYNNGEKHAGKALIKDAMQGNPYCQDTWVSSAKEIGII